MKLITLLLILAPICLAIDTILYTNYSSTCNGQAVICDNLRPNVRTPLLPSFPSNMIQQCCSARLDPPSQSVLFRYLPPEWNIEVRTYSASQCIENSLTNVKNMYGRDGPNKCVGGMRYQSAGYGFIDGKNESGEARECVQPNALLLVDGTKYNLAAMGETNAAQLLGMGSEIQKKDVPEPFKQYEIKAKD